MRRALLLVALVSCKPDRPGLAFVDLGERCEGTHRERACLTLRLRMDDVLRGLAPGNLAGDVHWSVYRGGEVGSGGPGSNVPVFIGVVEDADFGAAGVAVDATIPDVEARSYQGLAFLDDNASGAEDQGDPRTLPSVEFAVAAETHVTANLVLDDVR